MLISRYLYTIISLKPIQIFYQIGNKILFTRRKLDNYNKYLDKSLQKLFLTCEYNQHASCNKPTIVDSVFTFLNQEYDLMPLRLML